MKRLQYKKSRYMVEQNAIFDKYKMDMANRVLIITKLLRSDAEPRYNAWVEAPDIIKYAGAFVSQVGLKLNVLPKQKEEQKHIEEIFSSDNDKLNSLLEDIPNGIKCYNEIYALVMREAHFNEGVNDDD